MIVQHPNDILATKCSEVQMNWISIPPLEKETKDLIEVMIKALSTSGGIGLAAPQVGFAQKVIIVDLSAGTSEVSDLVVMINPKFRSKSKKTEEGIEECLSIPGRKFRVSRFKTIEVTFINSLGLERKIHADGFRARLIQHEIDHLNGITIADRGKEVI